jgi:hypothetical protein
MNEAQQEQLDAFEEQAQTAFLSLLPTIAQAIPKLGEVLDGTKKVVIITKPIRFYHKDLNGQSDYSNFDIGYTHEIEVK